MSIRKVSGGYKAVSESGKNLGGPYKTKAAAEKWPKQVEYFKHHPKKGKHKMTRPPVSFETVGR